MADFERLRTWAAANNFTTKRRSSYEGLYQDLRSSGCSIPAEFPVPKRLKVDVPNASAAAGDNAVLQIAKLAVVQSEIQATLMRQTADISNIKREVDLLKTQQQHDVRQQAAEYAHIKSEIESLKMEHQNDIRQQAADLRREIELVKMQLPQAQHTPTTVNGNINSVIKVLTEMNGTRRDPSSQLTNQLSCKYKITRSDATKDAVSAWIHHTFYARRRENGVTYSNFRVKHDLGDVITVSGVSNGAFLWFEKEMQELGLTLRRVD